MENQLKEDLKKGQLMENELVVATLRLVLSELTYLKVAKGLKNEEGATLSDADVLAVIQKELKKRRESADAFRKGNREELAEREEAEAAVLTTYLPEQLSDEQLTNTIDQVITELGASEIKDMGRVMAAVKAKVGSAGDGGKISQIVKGKLSA